MLQKYKTYKRNIHILVVEEGAGFGLIVTDISLFSQPSRTVLCEERRDPGRGPRWKCKSLPRRAADKLKRWCQHLHQRLSSPQHPGPSCYAAQIGFSVSRMGKKQQSSTRRHRLEDSWCRLELFLQSNNTWGESLLYHFAFWERVDQSHQGSSSIKWCPTGFQLTAQ